MQTRQVEVVLPEETFLRLEAAAEAAGQPEENAGYGYDDIRSIHGDGAYNKPASIA